MLLEKGGQTTLSPKSNMLDSIKSIREVDRAVCPPFSSSTKLEGLTVWMTFNPK